VEGSIPEALRRMEGLEPVGTELEVRAQTRVGRWGAGPATARPTETVGLPPLASDYSSARGVWGARGVGLVPSISARGLPGTIHIGGERQGATNYRQVGKSHDFQPATAGSPCQKPQAPQTTRTHPDSRWTVGRGLRFRVLSAS
jgi:hypothetical protein